MVEADLRSYEPGRRFALIFSNPPYIRKATGFLSGSAEKSAAKHELHGEISEIMRKTAEWLVPEGRACFVYPEKRRADFSRAADARGFRILRFRQVRPRAPEPANLFLVELGFEAVEPEIMPPLVLLAPMGNIPRKPKPSSPAPRSALGHEDVGQLFEGEELGVIQGRSPRFILDPGVGARREERLNGRKLSAA